MKKKTLTGLQNSGTDTQLRQVLSHLQILSPADGDQTCHTCGKPIRGGDSVTLHPSQPVSRSGYTVSQCRDIDHNDDLIDHFTLGTRELIVHGHIGMCHDQAPQQTWSVLLAPSLRMVSAADTKICRYVTSQTDRLTADREHGRLIQRRTNDHTGGQQPAPTSTITPELTRVNR